jgi:hypothetical protein
MSGKDAAVGLPRNIENSEGYLVAVHEAAHAVIAHHLGYPVHGLVIGLDGDIEGYIQHGLTTLKELGIRSEEINPADIWPHAVDEVHNHLLILFAGAMAVAKVTGVPYRDVKGGEGDNEGALHLIEELEVLRRRPELEFITDSYRSFLYPGSLLETTKLIGRDDLMRAILSVAGALVTGRNLTAEAFDAQMSEHGIAKGRRWFERGTSKERSIHEKD